MITLGPSLEGGSTVSGVSITNTIVEQGTTIRGTTVPGTTEVVTSKVGGGVMTPGSGGGSGSLPMSSSTSKAGGQGMYGGKVETGVWGVIGAVMLGILGL